MRNKAALRMLNMKTTDYKDNPATEAVRLAIPFAKQAAAYTDQLLESKDREIAALQDLIVRMDAIIAYYQYEYIPYGKRIRLSEDDEDELRHICEEVAERNN